MDYVSFKEAYSSHISIAIFTLLLSFILYNRSRPKYKLPPGPRGLPFVGYLPFLGKKPFKTFQELRRTYGDVFSIRIGNKTNVVLNSFSAVQEAFKNDSFLGRPRNAFRTDEKYSNLADMDGQVWVDHSKFTKVAMRGVGMDNSEATIKLNEELAKVFIKLEKQNFENDIDVRKLLAMSFENVVLSLLCSCTVDEEDEMKGVFQQFQRNIPEYFGIKSLSTSLPSWIEPIYLRIKRNPGFRENIQKVEGFFRKEIQSHKANLDKANPHDFIDYYFIEIKNQKPAFDELTLNGMLQIFFLGGSETSRTSMEWNLLYMARFQHIQDKIYEEIKKNLGTEKNASWADKEKLPYTWAFLLEVQRRKTVAPIGLNRRICEDTKLCGFDIPKDTIIMLNLWGIHMDERFFEKPKSFLPERFLTDNGTKVKTPEFFMPFSYGTRKCPGEKMAKMSIFLFFVSIVQKYRILPAKEGVNMTSECGTVTTAIHPYVRMTPR